MAIYGSTFKKGASDGSLLFRENLEEFITLSDGSTYRGEAIRKDGEYVPFGMGCRKFDDHNELGMFKNGILNGVAYINYHEWMKAGIADDGGLTGWGMYIKNGKMSFGVYVDDILKVDVSPLVTVLWNRVMDLLSMTNKGAAKVRKAPNEIFVGANEYLFTGAFGFHFLENGEVFVGQSEYGAKRSMTGVFYHFGTDYNITLGRYHDGELIEEIDQDEFVSKAEVWSSHEFIDFDISLNYSPDSFGLNEIKAYGITEIGNTPTALVVKASPLLRFGNTFQRMEEDEEKTLWFFFRNDDEIRDEFISIYEGNEIWVPDMDDFKVEFINNIREAGTDHLITFQHSSIWNPGRYYELNNEYLLDDEE